MGSSAAESYGSFADLAKHQARGQDYEILAIRRERSRVAVIAPHGGGIERRTSEIAREIAGEDFNLYLFEGIRPKENYAFLHLSSHRFDEPECLALIAHCPVVVAVHGCVGKEEKVLLGGLDAPLKDRIAGALTKAQILVEVDGHAFPATDPKNICNRGRSRQGMQLELTAAMRGSSQEVNLIAVVRSVLRELDGELNLNESSPSA